MAPTNKNKKPTKAALKKSAKNAQQKFKNYLKWQQQNYTHDIPQYQDILNQLNDMIQHVADDVCEQFIMMLTLDILRQCAILNDTIQEQNEEIKKQHNNELLDEFAKSIRDYNVIVMNRAGANIFVK